MIFLYSVRERESGRFVSSQGIAKHLFKVSEKSGNFILRLLQIILLDVFVETRQFCFKMYSETSLFLLIHGQNNHPARSVKIALQSVKSQGFLDQYQYLGNCAPTPPLTRQQH